MIDSLTDWMIDQGEADLLRAEAAQEYPDLHRGEDGGHWGQHSADGEG